LGLATLSPEARSQPVEVAEASPEGGVNDGAEDVMLFELALIGG
jgi:hypothetical protein